MTPIASAFWGLNVAWSATGRALRPVAEAEAWERAFTCTASDQAGLASWVANIRAAADEMATRIADMLMHMGGD